MYINLRRISKIEYRYVVYTQKEEKKAKSNHSNHSIYPISQVSLSCLFSSGPLVVHITLATKMKGRKLDSPRHDQQSPAKAHTYVDDSVGTSGTMGRTLRKNEYAAP